MPRKRFEPNPELNYHITARTHDRLAFRLPMDDVWKLFEDYLYFCGRAFDLKVECFVLMPNHFHLIARSESCRIPDAMGYMLREVSKSINRISGHINQNFGGPYHWSLIRDPYYAACAYKYVYRNPVEARLCRYVEHWPYSTIRGALGQSQLVIPTECGDDLVSSPESHLKWLNEAYKSETNQDLIRKALRRRDFAFRASLYTTGTFQPRDALLL